MVYGGCEGEGGGQGRSGELHRRRAERDEGREGVGTFFRRSEDVFCDDRETIYSLLWEIPGFQVVINVLNSDIIRLKFVTTEASIRMRWKTFLLKLREQVASEVILTLSPLKNDRK